MSRWRHFVVAIGLVPALILYVILVMKLADAVVNIHVILDVLFYLVTGLMWVPVAGRVVGWLAKHESH